MTTRAKNTTIAPMQTQRSSHVTTHPIEGMRLLDGETPEQKAAREAAAAVAAEAARVAAEAAAAETARLAVEAAAAETARIAAEAAEAERIAKDRKDGKLTDKEFEFLTDTLKHKKTAREAQKALEDATAKLKTFDGIDPAKIRELIANEATAKEAAAAAERAAIEKSGDVERIKAMMAAEHQTAIGTVKEQLLAKDTELNDAQKTINDLTVGSAFSQSSYIDKELVLTASVARQVYQSHFDVVKGKVVPFDKPRGETARTPLVDASGNALSVDAALKKLVEASPDRDKLVRSKLKPGAQSRTDNVRGEDLSVDNGLRGMARIQVGLAAGQLKKPTA